MKSISIIIPVYNEEKTIASLLDALIQTKLLNDLHKEILVVDDGSEDATAERMKTYLDTQSPG